jgi:hypothetical protein
MAGEQRPRMKQLPYLDIVQISHEIHDVVVAPSGDERQDDLVNMAMNNIRRFSKTRKSKKVILEWVEQNYPQHTGDEFALGIPMRVLELILAGVALFAI